MQSKCKSRMTLGAISNTRTSMHIAWGMTRRNQESVDSYGTMTSLGLWRHGDITHDWSAAMEECGLFQKDRVSRHGGRVALFVEGWLQCTELSFVANDRVVESLWGRIRGQSSAGKIVVGVCYRSGQEDQVDEAFFQQLEKALQSHALVLMSVSNHTFC